MVGTAAPWPTPILPPDVAAGPPGEEERLEALIGRLGELESGLRDELAVQVDRAEQAESALAAAEARAVRAEVAGRVAIPAPAPPEGQGGATPPAPALSTLAQGQPATASDEDREALATALREVRAYLERRRTIEAQIVTIARDALNALRQGASPAG